MTKSKGKRDAHHEEEEELYLHPPGQKTGFCNFLYDKQTGLVMGRCGKEWAQLIGFYLIFYTFLVAFWTACLFGFLSTVNTDKPNLLGYDSMLKLNPAMGYRPQTNFETNFIWYNQTIAGSYSDYVKDMNDFLVPYLNETVQDALVDCSDGNTKANKLQACKFNPIEVAQDCFNESGSNTYGFSTGQPCIILKMNRIYGWLPAFTPEGTARDVRVRCYGENDADNETLGEISYYPGGSDKDGSFGSLPGYYFPFLNQPNYVSPLVFVQFKNMKRYTVALIWCQLESEDMTFGSKPFWTSRALNERAGGVHFEILVDK